MHRLAELQSGFCAYLLSPPGPPGDTDLIGAVPDRGMPAVHRLGVYKNNVYARLIDALADTFPAVQRLVGKDFFRHAAIEFLTRNPPHSSTLIGYGAEFPDFLSAFPPARSIPYLTDVARLEQLYLEAYHSKDARAGTGRDLAPWIRGDIGAAVVTLHPSARLMRSAFPVSRIWEVNCQDEPIEGKVTIEGGAEHLLIIRPETLVEVRRLHPAAYAAVEALAKERSLDEARLAAARIDPGMPLDEHLESLARGATFCLRKQRRRHAEKIAESAKTELRETRFREPTLMETLVRETESGETGTRAGRR